MNPCPFSRFIADSNCSKQVNQIFTHICVLSHCITDKNEANIGGSKLLADRAIDVNVV